MSQKPVGAAKPNPAKRSKADPSKGLGRSWEKVAKITGLNVRKDMTPFGKGTPLPKKRTIHIPRDKRHQFSFAGVCPPPMEEMPNAKAYKFKPPNLRQRILNERKKANKDNKENKENKEPKLTKQEKASLNMRLRDFKRIRKIGEGGYGKVFLVEYKRTEELQALKILNFKQLAEQRLIQTVIHQIEIGSRCFHNPNIMRINNAFFEKKYLCLVMDFCPMGDLYQFMKRQPNRHLDDKTAAFMIAQIAKATQYLHNKHIIHRDIKPENVMLQVKPRENLVPYNHRTTMILKMAMREYDQRIVEQQKHGKLGAFMRKMGRSILSYMPGSKKQEVTLNHDETLIKRKFMDSFNSLNFRGPRSKRYYENFMNDVVPVIADFGWSAHTHCGRKLTQCGTIYYMAPEQFRGRIYSYEVDAWALGVLAYELTSGKLPFDGPRDKLIRMKVLSVQYNKPPQIALPAWQFITRILRQTPDARMNIRQILKHDWISKYVPHIKEDPSESEPKRRELRPILNGSKRRHLLNPPTPRFGRQMQRAKTPPPDRKKPMLSPIPGPTSKKGAEGNVRKPWRF